VKYRDKTFTLPVSNHKITQLEYDLRVGNITQREFDRLVKQQEMQ
jgi:hypothetical protein